MKSAQWFYDSSCFYKSVYYLFHCFRNLNILLCHCNTDMNNSFRALVFWEGTLQMQLDIGLGEWQQAFFKVCPRCWKLGKSWWIRWVFCTDLSLNGVGVKNCIFYILFILFAKDNIMNNHSLSLYLLAGSLPTSQYQIYLPIKIKL